MSLEATDVTALVSTLSPERLGNLVKLTGSQEAAIELHQETLRVCADLLVVTATVEIALRNSASENLSHHFGVPNWLSQPPVPFQWRRPEQDKVTLAVDGARRAEYAKLTQQQKAALDVLAYPNGRPAGTSHLKRAKDRRRQIQVTEGKVIAELTLYFWKRLYGPDYEQTLWRTALKRTFPDKKLPRADVAANLEVIYQARNRLAHHEPVLHSRFAATMKALTFVVERLGQPSPDKDAPLAKLLAPDMRKAQQTADTLHKRLAAFRI